MDTRIEFLYLSEQDTIQAGVNDAGKCIATCEEVFQLLARGDYLMGGSSHNSHGMGLIFPKESPFPNMPVAGPDRRFFAMPAYLGGKFDVCGCKWYGSNAANTSRGLPRSILTVTLNDKDTGAPLAFMSANLLRRPHRGDPRCGGQAPGPQGRQDGDGYRLRPHQPVLLPPHHGPDKGD